jgi:hypothetical protein
MVCLGSAPSIEPTGGTGSDRKGGEERCTGSGSGGGDYVRVGSGLVRFGASGTSERSSFHVIMRRVDRFEGMHGPD